MGLDLVELAADVEERFLISLDDQQSEQLSTVGDLHEQICAQYAYYGQNLCLSQVSFNAIRRAMMDALSLARYEVRPALMLEQLMPAQERIARWADLNEALWGRLGALEIPHKKIGAATIATLGGAAISGAVAGGAVGVLALGGLGIASAAMLKRGALEFPSGVATIGDLAKYFLRRNYGFFAKRWGAFSKEEAWLALRLSVVDCLGVRPEEVVVSARFVEDLGAG